MSIESIENGIVDLEGDVEQLEADAEEVGERRESMDKAVNRLADDVAVIEALAGNRKSIESAEDEIRERRSELVGEFSSLSDQLEQQMQALASDRSVLEGLAAIGEDVTESLAILDERQAWLETCQEQLGLLGDRLDVALEAYRLYGSEPQGVSEGSSEAPIVGDAAAGRHGMSDDRSNTIDHDGGTGSHVSEDRSSALWSTQPEDIRHPIGLTPGYGPKMSPTVSNYDDASRQASYEELTRRVTGLSQTREPLRGLPGGGTIYDSPHEMAGTLNWYQGLSDPNYQGTCGLCAVQNVARLAGKDVSEHDVVSLARREGLCETSPFLHPGDRGGTTPSERQELLRRIGIESYIDYTSGVDHLANLVEGGYGVIISVDVRNFWRGAMIFDQAGGHAVVVTSVERDVQGAPIAFHVCDSGIHDADYTVTADNLKASLIARRGFNVTMTPIR